MFYIKVSDSWRPVKCESISLLEYLLLLLIPHPPHPTPSKVKARKHLRGICLSDSEEGTIKSCCCYSCHFCIELIVYFWKVVYKLIYELFINLSTNLFSLASFALRTIPSYSGVFILSENMFRNRGLVNIYYHLSILEVRLFLYQHWSVLMT